MRSNVAQSLNTSSKASNVSSGGLALWRIASTIAASVIGITTALVLVGAVFGMLGGW